MDDATESVDKFERHLKAIGKGVQGLRGMFSGLRQARIGEHFLLSPVAYVEIPKELARYQRLLSYSLLSLITSTPLASSASSNPSHPEEDDEEEEDTSRAGLINSEGAWCWREGCDGMWVVLV